MSKPKVSACVPVLDDDQIMAPVEHRGSLIIGEMLEQLSSTAVVAVAGRAGGVAVV